MKTIKQPCAGVLCISILVYLYTGSVSEESTCCCWLLYAPKQPLQSRNTVGYRGVYKTASLKYQVRITVDSQKINIGTYETAKEAAVAWDRAVLKSSRSTSLLNFPDMVHNLDVEPNVQNINVQPLVTEE